MANVYDRNFNKNVVEVYTEEPGFTGFKGLDWTKLDSIEDILTGAAGTGPNSYLSGILTETTSIDGKLFITGDPYPAGVQGTIVFQADLTAQFDNVDVSGQAGNNINTIQSILSNVLTTGLNIPDGLNVYQANLTKSLDNVSISPIQSFSISNSTASGSNGTILQANEDRLELFVQNLATGALYVKYGISASDTSFNFVLAGNSYSNAGDGGSLSDQAYTGSVSVFSSATPNYISWERS